MCVVRDGADCDAVMDRAFGWFHEIEARCTRFQADSELMRLCAQVDVTVAVSAILFEAVQFALLVAEETGGAFDPAVGRRMEALGFDREHRSGEVIRSSHVLDSLASYRDVRLDPVARTITLLRPLTLDLGAVAKGLAVDAAARELVSFEDFAIDAGGDLFLGGVNAEGAAWSVGIRHPRHDGEVLETLHVSNVAVCTSGDYERGSHILDARTGESAGRVVSASVIAESAMMADALATAAFALGAHEGIEFLNRLQVEGLIVTADMERFETRSLRRAA